MFQLLDTFYRNYSRHLLVFMAVSLPLLAFEAARIPTNNNVETWLPAESELKLRYDQFRQDFGSEELIVLGLKNNGCDRQLAAAIANRIDKIPGVHHAWDSSKFRSLMQDLKVPEEAIQQRLIGMTESAQGDFLAVHIMLTNEGTDQRNQVVEAIRRELDYCQLTPQDFALAGGPVLIAELDHLGGQKNNRIFFLTTLLLGFLMLMCMLRDWKLSLATILITIWAIQATTAGIKWMSGEMNFILNVLPVMVMIFTLAIAIHFLHYYNDHRKISQAIIKGLSSAWKPCLFATLTTTIGLASLCISDIMPVQQFGYAASLGCIMSMLTALGAMPAVVTVVGFHGFQEASLQRLQQSIFQGIIRHRFVAMLIPLSLVVVTGMGLPQLRSKLEPLDFLPADNKVLVDVTEIQEKLTTLDSVEIVIDFDGNDSVFLDRLDIIRDIEARIADHHWIRQTVSPASFFPTIDQMPESGREIGALLKAASNQSSSSDYLACGQRFWRISARIEPEAREHQAQLVRELEQRLTDYPIIITGLAPLVKQAQDQIFAGFWSSFGTAFVIISVVMMISLRSVTTGLFAMIPNLTPLIIVFGTLGWFEVPIDIGMMMTGSIALGIAVDGTFHFLVRYEKDYKDHRDSREASRAALHHTGPAIAEAAIIAAVGMLALCMSEFAPTARFGILMSALLVAALVGDLVLLPAMLTMRNHLKATLKKPDLTPLHKTLKGPHRKPDPIHEPEFSKTS